MQSIDVYKVVIWKKKFLLVITIIDDVISGPEVGKKSVSGHLKRYYLRCHHAKKKSIRKTWTIFLHIRCTITFKPEKVECGTWEKNYRNSSAEMLCKISLLRNCAKFTRNRLWWCFCHNVIKKESLAQEFSLHTFKFSGCARQSKKPQTIYGL